MSPLPFLVGGALVILFTWAGFWQAGKAGVKRDEIEAFDERPSFTTFTSGNPVRPSEGLRVRGAWLGDRQIILDSIIVDSRVGHYVLTPFETGPEEPLLIVNRGFLPAREAGIGAADIAVDDSTQEILGRAGRLPRTGYRMGDAIPEVSGWPVHAVYPVYEDLEVTLGRDVQPFVLLLDPEAADGYARDWQPQGMSPARHTAYAVQWFAMAVVLTGLLAWHARRRSFEK